MAAQDRRTLPDIENKLISEGSAFSFYQVLRLLRSFAAAEKDNTMSDRIRIRPQISLAFPAADVNGVEAPEDEDGVDYRVTATFLGLYGTSSPLPTFYTEDLMAEASEDETVTREFIDIINHRIYLLLFQSWSKYRQFLTVEEEGRFDHLIRLFSLLGLSEEPLRKDIPNALGLLRYIGLLTQRPRSSLGLKTLLRDVTGGLPVDVVSCILRKVRIPEAQRLCLGRSGSQLGKDSYVGEEIEDRMGKFRIKIGPLLKNDFQRMLPGNADYERMTFFTKFYTTDPLEYDVVLTLAAGEARDVCLGQAPWSRLGLDTWLFSGEEIGEVSARFRPE